MSNSQKGKKLSEETRKRMSLSKIGCIISKEAREKIGLKNSVSQLGKKMSDETKIKIGLANKGEKCNFWRGGKSYEIYPVNWTNSLKIAIRERDHYQCQVCGEKQGDKTHSVHHIDYDKKNCNPDNLITLCKHCHSKTNHNREYWIKYLTFNKLSRISSV